MFYSAGSYLGDCWQNHEDVEHTASICDFIIRWNWYDAANIQLYTDNRW